MKQPGFPTSRDERYLEDYQEGAVHEFGPIGISQEEIIEFGRKYDPQAFHTDPEAAKQSIYGGLIASGWQSCALFMRLFVEHYLPGKASLGSPGVDELRWLKPVRPGDQLFLRVTVRQVKPSTSKPDRGALFSWCEMLNQDKEVVSTMLAINLISYRRQG
jgi:acyl dehydratase